MKVYKPKTWLVCIRCLFLVAFVMVINGTSLKKEDSILTLDANLDKTIDLEVIVENHESIYQAELYDTEGTFEGDLTAYVGDCPLCSGILACHPRTNVLEKGIWFDDAEYGEVRIVATSSKYSCGTILRFQVNKLGEEPIIAIAMDRGVGGNDVDLLVDDVDFAIRNVGRVRNQSFEVLRYGW